MQQITEKTVPTHIGRGTVQVTLSNHREIAYCKFLNCLLQIHKLLTANFKIAYCDF